MLEQFLQRNLNKTVEFLCRTGNGTSSVVSMTVQEQQAISMQNNGRCIGAYRHLLCAESSKHSELVYFCGCCGAVLNFLRNHSLILHTSQKSQSYGREILFSPEFRSDPFCNYIIAMCNRDVPLLLECISFIPSFWEAYLLLADIADKFIFIEGPLSPYFYMLLKVKKDIDPPDCVADFVKGVQPSLDILPYEIQTGDLNLLGAFLYAYGHTDAACAVFERIFFGNNFVDGCNGGDNSISANKNDIICGNNTTASTITANTIITGHPLKTADISLEENNGGNIPLLKYKNLKENHPSHAYCTAIEAMINRKARNDLKIEQLIQSINEKLGGDSINSENKVFASSGSTYSKDGNFCISSGSTQNYTHCKSYEYADIAAYILSTKNSPKLLFLIELLKMDHPNGPETCTARGIYQSSLADHKKARHFFKKSLQLQPSLDVMSMLAHTHIHLSERAEAIEVFSAALRMAPPNFRLFYSVSQGYFRLRMFEQSLFYARQALQSKSDGAVWKLVGRVHLHLQDYSAGAHALHKAVRMGEVDALLYLAELYKRLGRHERVADFYEQYIRVGERNKNTVLAYLVEYFKERGDVARSSLYREMML